MKHKSCSLLAWLLSWLIMLGQCLMPVSAADAGIDMYRLYNPNSGEHFYTAAAREKDYLVSVGWRYEGTGWVAPSSGTPVYRLYNPVAGDHHYTLQTRERDYLVAQGWKDEGTGWYSDTQLRVPLWREYNPNARTGTHNYTTNKTEHNYLCSIGWRDENIGWYGIKEGTPVASNGLSKLHVSGTQLLDANNQPVVLQGFSTFGLNYMPQYVDENVFRFLKNTMHSEIVRLAMYTQESGGYCSGGNQAQLKALIDKGVQAAKATGQYCIIDWHILSDGNPMTHINEAKAFFAEMANKYKDEDHVLYEICNEPNGVDWNTVRSYASQVIPQIRAHDPDGVILVGTPTWSQDVDIAAQNPLTGVSNVMYTLHFYAATHQDNIRSKLRSAHAKGLPVFVSEFGISSADGNGTLDPASGNAWISLLNEYGISRVAWALSNKNETSALFNPGTNTNLSLSSLSAAGQWVYETYTQKKVTPTPGPSQPSTPAAPGKVSPSLSLVNSWSEGDSNCYQYVLTVKNTGGSEISSWKVNVNFSTSVSVVNSWNGNFSASGKTISITPVDYNGTIAAGGQQTDIGFIVKVPASFGNLTYSLSS